MFLPLIKRRWQNMFGRCRLITERRNEPATHGEQEAIPESGWDENALWTRTQMSPCGMCVCVGLLFTLPLRGTEVGAAMAYNSWPDMSQCESVQHTDKDATCKCGHFLKLEGEQQTNSNESMQSPPKKQNNKTRWMTQLYANHPASAHISDAAAVWKMSQPKNSWSKTRLCLSVWLEGSTVSKG